MLKRIVSSLGILLLFFAFPGFAYSDFTVENILVEVGVSAGENSDGVGGHDFADVTLVVSDGVVGTTDYQYAEADFELSLEEMTESNEFMLLYHSNVSVMTGGQGTASALGNSIFVFELARSFIVNSLDGDAVLFNALGESIDLEQDSPVNFDAGRYSLSFGASAAILSNATVFEESNSSSGRISFTAVPEPTGFSVFCLVTIGLASRRRR